VRKLLLHWKDGIMRLGKKEIIALVRQNLTAREEIVFAYVFGSIVESNAFNDVDVGIYLNQSISDGFHYAFEMSGELERLLDCRVDVILMNTAPDCMIHSITKGELIVNNSDDVRVDFITAAWKRYWDFAFKRDMYLHDVAENVPHS
jgi:predicted nucleotidyltransferase